MMLESLDSKQSSSENRAPLDWAIQSIGFKCNGYVAQLVRAHHS